MDLQWLPIAKLLERFAANCAAISQRDARLASELATHRPSAAYFIAVARDQIHIARESGGKAAVVPCGVSPAAAQTVAAKLYPNGKYHAGLLIAGIDLGWLWQAIYSLPPGDPAQPGHRPPVYLAVREIEQVWVAMHLHDWREMLADPRVRLFVGTDAMARIGRSFIDELRLPWPKTSVTIDPQLWPAGVTLDTLLMQAQSTLSARLRAAQERLAAAYTWATPEALAARLSSGNPLRILGMTSRYTTFLQHSMRDWLAGLERLGHSTRLIIEPSDCEITNNLVVAETCAEFLPDVIVMIDHYRGEYGGLPAAVPCVMWVQDYLPNIFCAKAGAAQTDRDYVLGFGRLVCSRKHGYPEKRYMPATVAVNDARFAATEPTADELRRFGCDVSFVSHASTPADELLRRECASQNDLGRRVLESIYEQMRAVYEAGGVVDHVQHVQRFIDRAMLDHHANLPPEAMDQLTSIFTQQINNALFRHQALHWLAEMDVNLHLYGNGWEKHPRFARFARGPADNRAQLPSIYRCSKINLQIMPHGVVHQRLFEGLAAGGFFLIRHLPGEYAEVVYRSIWKWCRQNGIAEDEQLKAAATDEVRAWLKQVHELTRLDPLNREQPFMEILRLSADSGFTGTAGALWPLEYPRVSFNSAGELRERVAHYLAHEAERREVAGAMRGKVLERFTYVRTSERLLQFIASDLSAQAGERKLAV